MAYVAVRDSDSDFDSGYTMEVTRTSRPKEDTDLLNSGSSPTSDQPNPPSKYPRGVFFIVGNEFCERFSYYGMRAILVLYLTDWLAFSNDTATAIYHFFIVLCYFSPLGGAFIADGFLGKYKTILYLSIVYGVGNLIMSFTAFPPPHPAGPMIALVLIGLGTGGIKPCVAAFGGDQFRSDQAQQLTQFFSIFYFAINLGSLFSMIVTPLIRQNVHCFGTSCFPLAFGIPAALMIMSVVLFYLGRKLYKVYPPTGNIIGKMIMCVGRAIRNQCRTKESKENWLDYADDKYETKFIEEVRCVLRVFLMFLPLPIFWALFDQQGSRWILQAKEMNLVVGKLTIPPDLLQVLNPTMIILLIPLFEHCVYPLFAKCHLLKRPLQRMVVGMALASIAFVIAGFLQLKLDAALSRSTPVDHGSVSLINAAPCPVEISSPWLNDSLKTKHGTEIFEGADGMYSVHGSVGSCAALPGNKAASVDVTVVSGRAYQVVFSARDGHLTAQQFTYPTENPLPEQALVGFLYLSDLPLQTVGNTTGMFWLMSDDIQHSNSFTVEPYQQPEYRDIVPDTYTVRVPLSSGDELGTALKEPLYVYNGGIYTVIVQTDPSDAQQLALVVYEDVTPNDVSVVWQIPQYIVITIGEILFSISGLQFAYSQAPPSMKSVVQAGWLMTVSLGNLVDVIVAGAQLLPTQAAEFFFFAVLMAVVTAIFGVMSYYYKYVQQDRDYELEDDDKLAIIPTGGQHESVEETSLPPGDDGKS